MADTGTQAGIFGAVLGAFSLLLTYLKFGRNGTKRDSERMAQFELMMIRAIEKGNAPVLAKLSDIDDNLTHNFEKLEKNVNDTRHAIRNDITGVLLSLPKS
jgi:hypothetical protein